MKKFIYIIFALGMVLVSCQKEIPAEIPADDCYGVYFPNQELPGEMEPSTTVTSWTFKARRTNTEDNIIVPVTIKDSLGVYKVSAIAFEEGQRETTFTVETVSTLRAGSSYPFSLSIDNPKYSSLYSDKSSSLSFDISIVKWNVVTAGGSSVALYRDGIFPVAFLLDCPPYTEVTLQERADMKGMYRISNPYSAKYLQQIFGDTDNYSSVLYDSYLYIDATDPDKVWIDATEVGINWPGNGKFIICSNVTKCKLAADTMGGTAGDIYGTLKDGVISFPSNALCWGFDGALYGYINNDYTSIVFPGTRVYDYRVGLQVGLTEEGKGLPLTLSKSDDVITVRYAVVKGRLNSFEAETQASLLGSTSSTIKDYKETKTVGGVVYWTLDETTECTVIAAGFNSKGEYKCHAFAYANYLADGDDSKEVVLDINMFASNKYASEGLTDENSLQIFVSGAGLTDVKMAVYKDANYVEDYDKCIKNLKASGSVTPDILAGINSYNYAGVVSGMAPGSKYHFLVYASNGYDSVIKHVEASTNGEFNEIYDSYRLSDFVDEKMAKEAYFNEWNYYAVDLFGSSSQREYFGKVTISESDYLPESVGEDKDDYIDVAGLFTQGMKDIDTFDPKEDVVIFDYYKGVIYTLSNYFNPFEWKGHNIYGQTTFITEDGLASTFAGLLLGGFVKEGYLAFVDSEQYANAGTIFSGIGFFGYTNRAMTNAIGYFCAYKNILLVDPSVDTSGLDKNEKASGNQLSVYERVSQKFYSPDSFNYVETPQGRIKTIIDQVLADDERVTNYMDGFIQK